MNTIQATLTGWFRTLIPFLTEATLKIMVLHFWEMISTVCCQRCFILLHHIGGRGESQFSKNIAIGICTISLTVPVVPIWNNCGPLMVCQLFLRMMFSQTCHWPCGRGRCHDGCALPWRKSKALASQFSWTNCNPNTLALWGQSFSSNHQKD